MIDQYARRWARQHNVLLVEDPKLPEGTTFLDVERQLHFAAGLNLEEMMFHLNLTPEDRWWLEEARIGL